MTPLVRTSVLVAGFWGTFLVLSVLATLPIKNVEEVMVDRALLTILGIGCALPLIPMCGRCRNRFAGFLVLVPVAVAFGAAWSAAHRVTMEHVRGMLHGDPVYRLGPRVLFYHTSFYGVVLIAWCLVLFLAEALAIANREQLRAAAAEADARRMELKALRSQLQPHFLFNALNGISTLILERRHTDAAEMLDRLSGFLRTTIAGAGEDERTLQEELDGVRDYLAIEQARLGDRIEIALRVEEAALDSHIPTLLLQPLVENAVRHGIVPLETGGRLEIEARRAGPNAVVTLRNDTDGSEPEDDGVGLANVRARLATWRDGRSSLRVEREGFRWTVTVTLPQPES